MPQWLAAIPQGGRTEENDIIAILDCCFFLFCLVKIIKIMVFSILDFHFMNPISMQFVIFCSALYQIVFTLVKRFGVSVWKLSHSLHKSPVGFFLRKVNCCLI